jgi:hypothetical protein
MNRKSSALVGSENVRAATQQSLYNGQMTFPAGPVQRRIASSSLRLNVRSSTLAFAEDTSSCTIAFVGVQQLVDNGRMPLAAREVKSRPAVLVFRINFRTMIHQLLDNWNVSKDTGDVKRREAFSILGVHVRSNTQKPSNLWQVVVSTSCD